MGLTDSRGRLMGDTHKNDFIGPERYFKRRRLGFEPARGSEHLLSSRPPFTIRPPVCADVCFTYLRISSPPSLLAHTRNAHPDIMKPRGERAPRAHVRGVRKKFGHTNICPLWETFAGKGQYEGQYCGAGPVPL